jgi:hypothetical protein
LLAKQLALMSRFKSVLGNLTSVRIAQQNLLTNLSQRFRPVFFGWGSDEFSITNNLDTSEALGALVTANNVYDANAGKFIRMSDYQGVIIKLLTRQYGSKFGTNNSGGWSLLGPEHAPTLLLTTKSIDSLIQYAKLPGSDWRIIEPLKTTEFNSLKTVQIPQAVTKAIDFFSSQQRGEGSFGSVAETVSIVRLLDKIKSSGLITDVAILGRINSMLSLSITSFARSRPLKK